MTLKELYENYTKDWNNTYHNDEYHCYGDWLHNEFAESLDSLNDVTKCYIYNEYADRTARKMWDNIESLNEFQDDNFRELYRKIDHNDFNPYDDIIIEENCAIVSYSYAEFIRNYWNVDGIVNFIHSEGLESLIAMDIIVEAVK